METVFFDSFFRNRVFNFKIMQFVIFLVVVQIQVLSFNLQLQAIKNFQKSFTLLKVRKLTSM